MGYFMTDTAKPITLESIEETVSNVINAAMSRAIAERDKLVQSYKGAASNAGDVLERLDLAAQRMDRLERGAASVEASSLQITEALKAEAESVLSVLAEAKACRAGQYAAMVGQQVTIVGGQQRMVAAGLDEYGLMVCYWEHKEAVGVQEKRILPQALVLADTQVGTTKPAAKTSTARTARGVKATSTPSP